MPKIIIETEGTPETTKLTIDGKKVNNLSSLSIYADLKCWCESNPCWCTDVDFSYSIDKKDEKKGMNVRTRYSLDKSKASFNEKEEVCTNNPSLSDFVKM